MFGLNPPRISYLGLPRERSKEITEVNSYVDMLNIILEVCKFNLSLDIKIVCLDVSEFLLTNNFFEDPVEEESPEISELIHEINMLISKNGVRVCIFIGEKHFLASQLEQAKTNTVSILNRFSEILDIIGISYPSIMIRIGSAYGNRKNTMEEFCNRLNLLEKSVIPKLCVMNDDKPSLFSTTDLLSGVYYKTGIPICFRILPHQFNDGGLTIREALFLSCSTWADGKKPIFLYSESSEYDVNGIPVNVTPAEKLTKRIPTFGLDLDVIIDSPAKEDACLNYKMEYKSLPPIIINKIDKK